MEKIYFAQATPGEIMSYLMGPSIDEDPVESSTLEDTAVELSLVVKKPSYDRVNRFSYKDNSEVIGHAAYQLP